MLMVDNMITIKDRLLRNETKEFVEIERPVVQFETMNLLNRVHVLDMVTMAEPDD